jgi:protein phosphatase
MGSHVLKNQQNSLQRSIRDLQREGFRYIHVLKSQEEIDEVTIERQKLWTDRREETGPFDIIGDVHGCHTELIELLDALGWVPTNGSYAHPEGRKAIFLGDLVDRGPATPEVLRTVMSMVDEGQALCVPGNHDVKLMKALQGRSVTVSHGLAESLEQIDGEPPEFKKRVTEFVDALISHLMLDHGNLVVAHAGMNEKLMGRASARVRSFALFGETSGETDEYGLPVRYNWASDYRGKAMVAYGHTPVPDAEWVNNTICLDTGCVFGGKLTALRYPEKELVSVPARKMYYEPIRPLADERPQSAPRDDLSLDIGDVLGRRAVETRLVET